MTLSFYWVEEILSRRQKEKLCRQFKKEKNLFSTTKPTTTPKLVNHSAAFETNKIIVVWEVESKNKAAESKDKNLSNCLRAAQK